MNYALSTKIVETRPIASLHCFYADVFCCSKERQTSLQRIIAQIS
jgi:hypothetical protein